MHSQKYWHRLPKLSRLFRWHCRVKTFAACGVQAIFLHPMLYGIKESLCVLALYALGTGCATQQGGTA